MLLGAGASIHAGAPSTACITDRVSRLKHPVIKQVFEAMQRHQTGMTFNFEDVLASLHDLDHYVLRGQAPNAWHLLEGRLSAFTEFRPEFRGFGDSGGFWVAESELIIGIMDFVARQTRASDTTLLADFFRVLRRRFDLSVVTLNYDDLADRSAEDWFDGFLQRDTERFARFNPAEFRRRHKREPATLIHLHGSTRFGLPDQGSEIVKYPASATALASLQPCEMDIGSTLHPAVLGGRFPIISGYSKDRWMTRSPVPFGHYYNSFIDIICECPRLLIAGYGGGDMHVNAWALNEFHQVHGEHARLALIDLNDTIPIPEVPHLKPFLGKEAGNFPPDHKRTDELLEYFQ